MPGDRGSRDDATAPTEVAAARPTSNTIDDGRRASPRDAEVALTIGDRIGERYAIRGYLGEGGMGAVYRAYDEVLGEEVALKVMRGGLAVETRDEVRVAQQVTHRNVCRTYDLEDIDGRQFIKMEYIAGETLGARIDAGPMPVASAVTIARAIVDGLTAAHAQGIVHRDLKPGNVMLCGERVVLMDFGLARKVTDVSSELSGTPAYMSPEQLAGAQVDERSDLFALGCLLYEMLAGERAFVLQGTFTEIVAQRETHRAAEVRSKRAGTPRWLARAVAELMAHDPVVRSRGKAHLLRGPSRARIFVPILAIILLAAITWLAVRPATPWHAAIRDLHRYVGNVDAPALSPDGKSIAYAGDPSNSGKWAAFVRPIDGGVPRQLSPPNTHCFAPRWTVDGQALLMSCRLDGEWRILKQAASDRTPLDLGPGRYVDDCGDALMVTIDTAKGTKIVMRANGHDTPVLEVDKQVTFARCDGRDHIAFIEGSRTGYSGSDAFLSDRHGVTRVLASSVEALAFTPGGRSVVLARTSGTGGEIQTTLVELVLDTGQERAVTPTEQHATAPEISRDGTMLVFHRDMTSDTLSELVATSLERRSYGTGSLDYLSPSARGDVVYAEKETADGPAIIAIAVSDGTERRLVSGQTPFLSRDGSQVLFRDAKEHRVLRAVPVGGGLDHVVGKIDGSIEDGVDAADGQHLSLDRGDTLEAWLLPSGGGPAVSEGVLGLVIPSRTGGWRVVRTREVDGRIRLDFIAPDQPLSTIAFVRTAMPGRPAWLDDRRVAYCDDKLCHVLDVVDPTHDETRPHGFGSEDEYVVAPETLRWFTTRESAQVTLHQLTNFDRRPWKP